MAMLPRLLADPFTLEVSRAVNVAVIAAENRP